MNKLDLLSSITEEQLLVWCDKYSSATEILEKEFNMSVGGKRTYIIRNKMKNYDIEFLDAFSKSRKYKVIEKECPICSKLFKAKQNHPKEQITCSKGCAQTYFNSGELNSRYSGTAYRAKCFAKFGHKCIVCNENLIVEVHHLDKNHDNNDINNLIPLCPTHHAYIHNNKYRYILEEIIDSMGSNPIGHP